MMKLTINMDSIICQQNRKDINFVLHLHCITFIYVMQVRNRFKLIKLAPILIKIRPFQVLVLNLNPQRYGLELSWWYGVNLPDFEVLIYLITTGWTV